MYSSTPWDWGNNANCYSKLIMTLHYIFCKNLVPWMSPPCIAMLLETGDWPEFWYQHNFRYCRVDIAYKISKLFKRGPMLTMWVVWLQYWCCVSVPTAGLAVPLGRLRLRVPLHSGHLYNTQHCVSNDCRVTARDLLTMCSVKPLKQQGRTPLPYTDFLYVFNRWVAKWMTYTIKLFDLPSL